MSSMAIDQIEDDDELYKMLNQTESFDERKKIRARIREVREKKLADLERQKAEREAKPQESAIEMRLRQAEAAKAKKMQRFADEAKQGHKDVGTTEKALQEKLARAEQEKKAKIKQITEVGQALTSAMKEGDNIVKKAEEAASQKLRQKHENEDAAYSSTKTERRGDGGTTVTSVSSTRQTSRGGGRGGAMAAFKQMDASTAPPGGAKPNYLSPGGRGGGRGVAVQRSPSAIKQMLLDWCKAMTRGYEGVEVTNFSSSWNDGMAFCALIHHFHPEAFDFSKLNPKNRRGNFQLAFDVAEKYADISPLLEVDDMVRMKNPDWKCVFCYVQSFYRKFRTAEIQQQQQQAAEQ